MRRYTFLPVLVCAGVAALPAGAGAQTVSAEPWLRAGSLLATLEFGGAAFSDFQRARAHSAQPSVDVPNFERRVSAGTTATVGGSLAYWISDGAALRGAVAYAPSRFSVWNDGQGQRAIDQHSSGDAPPSAKLGVWLANAALVFRLPVHLGRVVPYGIAGAGAVHYRIIDDAEVPPEARRMFANGQWTGAAAVFGIGTTLPLQRNNLLMTFELTNHLARTPLNDEGAGEWFEISGVPLQLAQPQRTSTDAIAVTSNLRLTLGLTLPLRTRPLPPTPPIP